MEVFYVYLLTMSITSTLLVIVYIVSLIKVLSGQAFKKIILIISMLLVANIAYLV